MEQPKSLVHVQKEKLNINEIIEAVTSPTCGAISTFIGTTRNNFESKEVIKLEYEIYEPMAVKEMAKICSKIREKWAVHHIAIYHRFGEVPVCESSVVIAISSPHRKESLQAVEFAIDELKSSVPIWKKEFYHDEEAQWKENKEWKEKAIVKIEPLDHNADEPNTPEHDEDEVYNICNEPQVKCCNEELNRRLSAWCSRRKEQANATNMQEFCSEESNNGENSCARVDTILTRHENSKSHVKVYRVVNTSGPQTRSLPVHQTASQESISVLDERLLGPEKFLGIEKPVPKNIYARIKNIENKIMYLENLVPEYQLCHEGLNVPVKFNKLSQKRTYSGAELDSKLIRLEEKYAKHLE